MTFSDSEIDLLLDIQPQVNIRNQTLDKYWRKNEKVQTILARLEKDKGFIDEHNGRWRDCVIYAVYVCYNSETNQDEAYVTPVQYSSFFSINPLVAEEKSCHMRRYTLGSHVIADDDLPILDRLLKFNKKQSQNLATTAGTFLAIITFQGTSKVSQILI